MRKRSIVVGLALAILASGYAAAETFDSPTGLRGYRLGMTLAEARRVPHPDGIPNTRFSCARAVYNGHPTPPMDLARIRELAQQSIRYNTPTLRHPFDKASEQVLFFGGIRCSLLQPPIGADKQYYRDSSPAEFKVAGAPSNLIFIFGPTHDFTGAQPEDEHRLMVIEGNVELDQPVLLAALQGRYGPYELNRERVRRFDGREEIVETPVWRTRDGDYLLVAEPRNSLSYQAPRLVADLTARFDAAIARERTNLMSNATQERSKQF